MDNLSLEKINTASLAILANLRQMKRAKNLITKIVNNHVNSCCEDREVVTSWTNDIERVELSNFERVRFSAFCGSCYMDIVDISITTNGIKILTEETK